MAEIALLFCISAIAYVYFMYPLLVIIMGRLFARPVVQDEIAPSISVIITAYNEEKGIRAKLENTIALHYPKEKLEIIVASDCSSDQTEDIVRSFESSGVKLHRCSERLGKTVAQRAAVRESTGEILVLSDATTIYRIDALERIVKNFADPGVGCVAGQLIYSQDGGDIDRNCKSYWSFEKLLKQSESSVGTLIGVSGCLYAVRRNCFSNLAPDMIDDFVVATETYLKGLRSVYEPEAVAIETANSRSRDEFRMRVRVIEQTLRALFKYRSVLDPFRHSLFAFQLISHKVLRYAVPFLLIFTLILSTVLIHGPLLYKLLLAAQVIFYLLALAGLCADRLGRKLGPLSIPYYFVLVNAAVIAASYKFCRGDAQIIWTPQR